MGAPSVNLPGYMERFGMVDTVQPKEASALAKASQGAPRPQMSLQQQPDHPQIPQRLSADIVDLQDLKNPSSLWSGFPGPGSAFAPTVTPSAALDSSATAGLESLAKRAASPRWQWDTGGRSLMPEGQALRASTAFSGGQSASTSPGPSQRDYASLDDAASLDANVHLTMQGLGLGHRPVGLAEGPAVPLSGVPHEAAFPARPPAGPRDSLGLLERERDAAQR